MKILSGNLFDSDVEVMAHQVNCLGVMGSGIAKEVKSRFPDVYAQYKKLCMDEQNKKNLLGRAQVIKQGDIYIANVFGQLNFNPTWYLGGKVTDYAALTAGFSEVRKFMVEHGLKRLGVPYLFGCCRGGGKWEEVEKIIDTVFLYSNIEVTAYKI